MAHMQAAWHSLVPTFFTTMCTIAILIGVSEIPVIVAANRDELIVRGDAKRVRVAYVATCIHSEHYGTRSSTLVAFEQGRVGAYLHADGSPCVTPCVDRTELLS